MTFVWLQLVISLIIATALWVFGTPHQTWSFLIGAGLSMIIWVSLLIIWSQILGKKSIALAVSIIVIKYALLAYLLVVIVRTEWIQALAVGFGVATVLPVALAAGALAKFGNAQRGS